eukprot:491267_1
MSSLLVVGKNSHGEFGVNSKYPFLALTRIHENKTITNVFSGADYSIYCIIHQGHKQYWSAGDNSNGSCGNNIKYEPTITVLCPVHFVHNNINIKKVCVNVNRNCTFWISDTNKVYANGRNMYRKLGLNDKLDRYAPELVEYLDDDYYVIDIQSTYSHTFALCAANHENIKIIVDNWIKQIQNTIHILPKAVIHLIILFYGINKVYTTQVFVNIEPWKEMEIFSDINIVKIRTGYSHSLLLQSNGMVWCYGDNDKYQLGISDDDNNYKQILYEPVQIPLFVNIKICISDIKCGENHNLAIGDNHEVYSWGDNTYGQCGIVIKQTNGIFMEIKQPTVIKDLESYSYGVVAIDCGTNHSYCKLANDSHFLFGSNTYNECLHPKLSKVERPLCINDIIKETTGGKVIESISLGCNNTKIVVTDQYTK